MKKIIIILILLTSFLYGINSPKVALTGKIINKYGLKEQDIKKIQFCILDEVVLTKEIKKQKLNVGKKFKQINTVDVSEVFIKANTTCIVTKATTDTLWVNFDEDKQLLFTKKNKNEAFNLAGIKTNAGYNVFYDGKIYQMTPYKFVALYFDFSEEKIVNKKRKQIKGATIK